MEKGIIEMLNKMSSFVFLLTTLIIFSNFTYGLKVSPTSTGSYYSGTKSVGSTILFTGSSSHAMIAKHLIIRLNGNGILIMPVPFTRVHLQPHLQLPMFIKVQE